MSVIEEMIEAIQEPLNETLIDGMQICADTLKEMMDEPKFQEVVAQIEDGFDSKGEALKFGITMCIDFIQKQVDEERKEQS